MWLHRIAQVSLLLGVLSAIVIAADILGGRRQKMWIMDVVWPVTGLYGGLLALYAYSKLGRVSSISDAPAAVRRAKAGKEPENEKPFWQAVGIGALHCGSGCTLGDLAAEWLVVAFPIAIAGHRLFGSWIVDYIFAFAFGIAFQYFSIKPMRNLSVKDGLKSALKADSASLTAWQVGMYGWMAISVFLIFGHELEKTDPVFWFMMQIAMLAGFLTSYPVNWWLLSKGIKEKM
jgi:hypothetical protein